MNKIRFVIVGSGWRSLSYVKIAKALPEKFELCAMLCRTKEKAERMAAEQGIYATTSMQECREMNPDFVVVVVSKASIAQVSMEWMEHGFTVLCETPASLELPVLDQLWQLHKEGKRLVVAEQYTKRPLYQAMLSVVEEGLLGEPDCVNLSLAHEYHGARLMRAFLKEDVTTPFTINAKTYLFKTVETLSRYERFTDGRTAEKKRTAATFEFADGKVAWYDFDSEEYRSPIRKKSVCVRGCKGELRDAKVYFLDENFEAGEGELKVTERVISTDNPNPNLQTIREVESIVFRSNRGEEQVVYDALFGMCTLTEDQTAMAQLMVEAAEYTWAAEVLANVEDIAAERKAEAIKADEIEADETIADEIEADREKAMTVVGQRREDLKEALQDCYMAILLQEAIRTGETVISEEQSWMKKV